MQEVYALRDWNVIKKFHLHQSIWRHQASTFSIKLTCLDSNSHSMKTRKVGGLSLPPYIGSYGINNVKSFRIKGETLVTYHFDKEILRSHDPLNAVPNIL